MNRTSPCDDWLVPSAPLMITWMGKLASGLWNRTLHETLQEFIYKGYGVTPLLRRYDFKQKSYISEFCRGMFSHYLISIVPLAELVLTVQSSQITRLITDLYYKDVMNASADVRSTNGYNCVTLHRSWRGSYLQDRIGEVAMKNLNKLHCLI